MSFRFVVILCLSLMASCSSRNFNPNVSNQGDHFEAIGSLNK